MTTLYDRNIDRFWVVDSLTLIPIANFPAYKTWKEAREAIGECWHSPDIDHEI